MATFLQRGTNVWPVVVAAVVIGLAPTAARADDAYPVRLSEPAHVGDTQRVTTQVKRHASQIWTDAGNPRKPVVTDFTATLEATETVDAIGANGRATKVTEKVARCTKDGVDLLPPGTAIVAETIDGRTEFKVDGASPTDGVRDVLRQLIYTARPDEPTGDEEFGTDRPRHVGESWPAKTEAMVKATHLPFRVTADDFKGQAKLLGVATVDGRPTETVSLTQHCQFASRPAHDGSTIKDLRMDREITLVIAVDPTTTHASSRRATFKESQTAVGSTGTEVITGEETSESTYTDVKR